jgi:hypothetical protein
MSVHSIPSKKDLSISEPLDVSSIERGSVAPKDGDAALAFLRSEEIVEFTPEQEKKLVRKIDWMIVPLMWSCYFLQYLDKTLSMFPFFSLTQFWDCP